MININLVGEGRKVTRAERAGTPSGGGGGGGLASLFSNENRNNTMLYSGILLGVLISGGWWFLKSSTIKANAEEITQKEERVRELQDIIRQVDLYKARVADLENRKETIDRLKDQQRGPVQTMDFLSKALPELLWLDSLRQETDRLTVNGRAMNLSAVGTYITNLKAVPEFGEPTLINTQKSGEVYNFSLVIVKRAARPEEGA